MTSLHKELFQKNNKERTKKTVPFIPNQQVTLPEV